VNAFDTPAAILADAVAARAFPAAVAEVGRADAVLWRQPFGRLTYDEHSLDTTFDTIFDIASLTKVIATTTLAMRALDAGAIALDDPIARWLPDWYGADRGAVTIEDLLAHASGLPAYLPFYRDCTGRAEFEAEICRVALEYPPRTQSIYSDLGFILLAFVLEDARSGRPPGARGHVLNPATTFAAQFRMLASFLTHEPLCFNPSRATRQRIAPTEFDAWRGRLLCGETHDENAWALGGAAGHSGLFGTAAAVGTFARAVLRTIAGEEILAKPDTFRRFIRRTNVPGSSRALGWDTMLPTSSCGTLMSPTAIGHTGFTGTTLWIDWERNLYVVLLTNRVHPTRENNAHKRIRPAFHDAVLRALTR
jgi:CubicO group peptidase (beta-lactamase class C family)